MKTSYYEAEQKLKEKPCAIHIAYCDDTIVFFADNLTSSGSTSFYQIR